jgi:hypothetical protein
LREARWSYIHYSLTTPTKGFGTKKNQSKESKDNFKHTRRSVNYVDYDSDSSSDESNDVYAAKFCWPSKTKSYAFDATLSSQFIKIGKKKLNLLLM